MRTTGTVREWHDEDGWGVVDSPDTPGGCWVHFSHLDSPGYRGLTPGQVVLVEYEHPGQDGFAYRAVRVRLPGPSGEQGAPPPRAEAPSAYRSALTLSFDRPTGQGPTGRGPAGPAPAEPGR